MVSCTSCPCLVPSPAVASMLPEVSMATTRLVCALRLCSALKFRFGSARTTSPEELPRAISPFGVGLLIISTPLVRVSTCTTASSFGWRHQNHSMLAKLRLCNWNEEVHGAIPWDDIQCQFDFSESQNILNCLLSNSDWQTQSAEAIKACRLTAQSIYEVWVNCGNRVHQPSSVYIHGANLARVPANDGKLRRLGVHCTGSQAALLRAKIMFALFATCDLAYTCQHCCCKAAKQQSKVCILAALCESN